jgi:hypothetical protein
VVEVVQAAGGLVPIEQGDAEVVEIRGADASGGTDRVGASM